MKDFEKELAPYLLALQLKALGFDFSVIAWSDVYTDHIILMSPDNWCNMNIRKDCVSRPTYSQAFRWFREKYNLFGKVYIVNFGADEYSFNIYDLYEEKYKYENFIGAGASYIGIFETYEEAELECLKKLIEIVKEKL